MNFKELEELINSGLEVIALTEDVILDDGEEELCPDAIDIIADGLIIDGNNHTIDGKGKVPILYIEAPNVILKNIIFKNGFSEFIGGAISNYSNDLRIVHCQFIDNSTDSPSELYGGAIYNAPGSNSFIEKSIFKDNGSDFGGAIFIDSDSSIDLRGSVFESNSCEFDGGAIYNKGELIVNDSIFNNNAAFYGGAIYNEKDLIIKNSFFRNNIGSEGYDIKTENEDIVVLNSQCEFINNE